MGTWTALVAPTGREAMAAMRGIALQHHSSGECVHEMLQGICQPVVIGAAAVAVAAVATEVVPKGARPEGDRGAVGSSQIDVSVPLMTTPAEGRTDACGA